MSPTLMMVEDHAHFRAWLKERVQEWFPWVTVVEAGDVPEALRAAAEHAPEAVLMDIHLPGGSGLRLTRQLKADLPGTTVIVCTGETAPEFRAAAFASGASYFVPKEELLTAGLRTMIEVALEAADAGPGRRGNPTPFP